MFMPDYGTVQLLYEDRLRDIERRGHSLMPIFEIRKGLPGRLFAGLGQRLRHSPVHLTRYEPAHQKS